MNPREVLKERLMLERHAACDGQRKEAHYCGGGYPDMHEAIFSRDDARGSPELLKYTNHQTNCILLCQFFHGRYGRSRDFRVWVILLQISRYGAQAVFDYISGWPGVVNPVGAFGSVGKMMYWLKESEEASTRPASRRPAPRRSP